MSDLRPFRLSLAGPRWTPARLIQPGQAGYWAGGYDPASGRLYQDSAGTTPVTAPGQPVGLARRRAGTVDAAQPTAAARPTMGRWPQRGRRNLLASSALSGSGWSGTTTQALVGGDWWSVTRSAAASQYLLNNLGSVAAGTYTLSIRLRAGIAPAAHIGVRQSDWMTPLSYGLTGPGSIAFGGTLQVSGLSATEASVLTAVFALPAAATAIYLYPRSAGAPHYAGDSFLVALPQWETGSTASAPQRVTSALDITEDGIPTVYHLYDDGVDDALPATLPAGVYGRAIVGADGVVTVDTVTDPADALQWSRQAGVILRAGAFTAAEESRIRTYWESRYA